MTKEELLEDISIFDDKDIIEKLNENKELRDWFLVELNVSLQNAERVTAGYKEMKCYKNAVTSLQIENQELKADYGTKVQVERDMLQQENQELQKENEKNKHYKTLYQSLKRQKEELRSWLKEGFSYDTGVVDEHFIEAIENVLNKMEELEGVNDESKRDV